MISLQYTTFYKHGSSQEMTNFCCVITDNFQNILKLPYLVTGFPQNMTGILYLHNIGNCFYSIQLFTEAIKIQLQNAIRFIQPQKLAHNTVIPLSTIFLSTFTFKQRSKHTFAKHCVISRHQV